MGSARRDIRYRIFLVGCPRSGTTLLQSMAGAHPALTTFPETHFFHHVAGRGRRARLGLVSGAAGDVVAPLHEIGLEFDVPRLPASRRPDPRLSAWSRSFVRLLDTRARSRGAQGWLEKTPRHLRHLDAIHHTIPRSTFVHLIRDGRATVTSLVAVRSAGHPSWGVTPSAPADLVAECAQRWAHDLRLSHARRHDPAHSFVCFEDLVDDPAGHATRLFERLQLPPAAGGEILERRSAGVGGVVLPWETWKAGVSEDVAPASRDVDSPAARLVAEHQDIVEAALAGTADLVADLPFV